MALNCARGQGHVFLKKKTLQASYGLLSAVPAVPALSEPLVAVAMTTACIVVYCPTHFMEAFPSCYGHL